MPTGEPQITQIGLSVVSATSTRSGASRSLIGGKAPVIGDDEHADVGIGEERVEDLAAAPVADRVPAVVDRVARPAGTAGSTRGAASWLGAASRGSRSPAAGTMSAMWAPVPPEIE